MRWKRKVFLINEGGKVEYAFEGKIDAKRYLEQLGFSENKVETVIKSEEPFLGFVWVSDPDYEYSIPCTAHNENSSETREFSSITKCREDFFGKEDPSVASKIRKIIESGELINGFTITEDDNTFINYNHPKMPGKVGEGQRPVFEVNARTGDIIEKFDSCSLAAIPIFLRGNSTSSVNRINDNILCAAKRKRPTAYGYKWVEDWEE